MIDLTNDNDDGNDDDSTVKVLCILSLLVLVAVHTALRGKEGKICISTFFLANNIALLYLPLSWNDKKDHLDVHLIGQEETFILMTMLVIIFNAIIICLYNHQHNHNHCHDHFHHNPHRHCHNVYSLRRWSSSRRRRRGGEPSGN